MREMKFRQPMFDTNGNFIHWHYWGFVSDGRFDGIQTGTSSSIKQAQETSQQYTSLKDKNGKEIYEGDIVACTLYHYGYLARIENITVQYGKFLRPNHNAGFYPFHDTINAFEIITSEVIGNIYENPELLEDLR